VRVTGNTVEKSHLAIRSNVIRIYDQEENNPEEEVEETGVHVFD
jgi:hypothetical protein